MNRWTRETVFTESAAKFLRRAARGGERGGFKGTEAGFRNPRQRPVKVTGQFAGDGVELQPRNQAATSLGWIFTLVRKASTIISKMTADIAAENIQNERQSCTTVPPAVWVK